MAQDEIWYHLNAQTKARPDAIDLVGSCNQPHNYLAGNRRYYELESTSMDCFQRDDELEAWQRTAGGQGGYVRTFRLGNCVFSDHLLPTGWAVAGFFV